MYDILRLHDIYLYVDTVIVVFVILPLWALDVVDMSMIFITMDLARSGIVSEGRELPKDQAGVRDQFLEIR